jgi:hypothetical protein
MGDVLSEALSTQTETQTEAQTETETQTEADPEADLPAVNAREAQFVGRVEYAEPSPELQAAIQAGKNANLADVTAPDLTINVPTGGPETGAFGLSGPNDASGYAGSYGGPQGSYGDLSGISAAGFGGLSAGMNASGSEAAANESENQGSPYGDLSGYLGFGASQSAGPAGAFGTSGPADASGYAGSLGTATGGAQMASGTGAVGGYGDMTGSATGAYSGTYGGSQTAGTTTGTSNGQTAGGAPAGQTAASNNSAQQVVSTTPDDYTKGTDGSAASTENAAQQAAASTTKNLTLNTAALSNLANFLSTQNSAVTPGGITPYVGVPAGSGIAAPVIPEFGGVSYPTGTASSGSSGSGTA